VCLAPLHLTHLRPQVPPIWAMLPLQCITPPSQQPQFPTYTLQTAELPQPHSFRYSSIICLRSKTSTSRAESWPLSDSRRGILPHITVPLFLPHAEKFRPATSPSVSTSLMRKATLLIPTKQPGEAHGQTVHYPKAWLYIGCC
jgi:hypothetical protein